MRLSHFAALVLALAVVTMPQIVSAQVLAPESCQSALDVPNINEAERKDADGHSQFGNNVQEIDGRKFAKLEELVTAINAVSGRVPLVLGGNFSGWDFSKFGGGMRTVCFFETELQNSKWDGGHFDGIGFIKTPLDGATFEKARMKKVLLREAGLTGVSMRGADLRGGLLDGGWGGSVENWDATGADMRSFVFQCGITIGDGCPLDRTGTKFVNVDFRGADIATYVFWGGADYHGARMENAKIAPRQIKELAGIDFGSGVQLVGGEVSIALNAEELGILQREIAKSESLRAKPSFDCAKAQTRVEKIICRNEGYDLPVLDRRMAEAYGAVRPKNPAAAAAQKQWLAARNACSDGYCLMESYKKRLAVLTAMLGEPEILQRGESALFYDEQIALSSDFTQTPLFAKIKAVLFGASMGEAILSRAADGSYSIMGESVGANGHMCSAGGQGLRFDAASGWFSGAATGARKGRAAVFRVIDNEIEFPGNGHPNEEEFPGSEEYASCGMRGVLGPLKRIDLGTEALEKRRIIMTELNG